MPKPRPKAQFDTAAQQAWFDQDLQELPAEPVPERRLGTRRLVLIIGGAILLVGVLFPLLIPARPTKTLPSIAVAPPPSPATAPVAAAAPLPETSSQAPASARAPAPAPTARPRHRPPRAAKSSVPATRRGNAFKAPASAAKPVKSHF